MRRKWSKRLAIFTLAALTLLSTPFVPAGMKAYAAPGNVTADGVFAAPASDEFIGGLMTTGYLFGSGAHTGSFTIGFDVSITAGLPTGNLGFGAYVTSLQSRPIDVSFEGRPGEGAYKKAMAGGVEFPFDTGDQFHFAYSIDTAAQKYNIVVTKGATQLVNQSNVSFAAENIGMLGVRNHAGGSFAVLNLTVGGVAENLVNAVDDVNDPPALVRPAGGVFEVGPSRAFRKIQDVVSLLQPGDTVLVDPGTYPGGIILPAAISGTESHPITIRGIKDAQGKRPVIKAQGATNNIEAIADNLVLESLDIAGNQDELMAETGTTYGQLKSGEVNNHTASWNARITQRGIFHRDDNLVVRDSIIRDHGSGILSSDDGGGSITIEHNEIYDNGSGNGAHNIYLTTAQFNYPHAVARIQYNYIHEELGSGANIKSRATRNEIYYNWIAEARDLAMELAGPDGEAIKDMNKGYDVEVNTYREDSDIVGNVIVESDGSWGVRMGGDKDMAQTYGRYRFVNNTFLMGGGAPLRVEVGTIESLELYNNIFHSATNTGELFRVRDPESYFSAWSNGAEQVAGSSNWISNRYTGGIPGGLTGTIRGDDPGFNDLPGGDYSLRSDTALTGVAMNQTVHTWDFWTANGGQGHQINGYEQYAYLQDIDTAFPNPLMELYETPVNRSLVQGYRADALTPASAPSIGAYPTMLPSEETVDGKVVHRVFVSEPNNGHIELAANKVGEGDDVAITATANAGYYFTGWTVSGEGATVSAAKSAAATLTMGIADATIGAAFAPAGGTETEKRYIFDGTLNNIRPFQYWGDAYLPEDRYLVKSVDGAVTMKYDGDYWAGYDASNVKLFQVYHQDGTAEDALTWSRVGGYSGPVPYDEGAVEAGMKFTIRATGAAGELFDIRFIHGADTVGIASPSFVIKAQVTSSLPSDTTFMLGGTNKNNDPQWRPVAGGEFTTEHQFWMYDNKPVAGIALSDNGEIKSYAWSGDYSGMTADIAEIYFAGPGSTPIANTLTLAQPLGGTIGIDGQSGNGGSGGSGIDKRPIFDGTLNNIRPFQYWGSAYLPEDRYLVKSADGSVTMEYDGDYWAGYDASNVKLFQVYHQTGTAEDALTWSRVGGYSGPVPYDEGAVQAGMKFTIRATGAGSELFDLRFIHGADTVGIETPSIAINAKATSSLPAETSFMLGGTNKNNDPNWRPVAGTEFTTDHLFWMYDNKPSAGMALGDNGEIKAFAWSGDYSGMTVDIAEIYFAGPGTGETEEPASDGTYAPGDAVNVTATEQAGYTFIGWQTLGGGSFANAAAQSTQFYMPADDVVITAQYAAQGSEPLARLGVDYSGMNRKYIIGDTLDLAGLALKAYYAGLANPVDINLSNAVYSVDGGAEMTAAQAQAYVLNGPAGNRKLTVSYTSGGLTQSAAFTIRVNDPIALIGVIVKKPYITVYSSGDALNLAGMEVVGLYSDGTSRAFASSEYSLKLFVNGTGAGSTVTDGQTLTQAGAHRIDVTAGGTTRSFDITVAPELAGI